jgi:tetratricopeptide (TPR) repeat protein
MLLLCAATLASFWSVTACAFVNYDDRAVFLDQPLRHGLTWQGIIWGLRNPAVGHWQPITCVSHMLDFQLFGANPAGHHASSLILHLIGVLLLYAALKRMTGRPWESACAAALFAVHPLQVESVAWVTERRNVVSGFFWMLGLYAYACYVEHPTGRRYAAVAAALVLGLLSKPVLVTLPFVFLLLDFWPLRRPQGGPRLVLEKIPFFILAAGFSWITCLTQQPSRLNHFPLAQRLANGLLSYTRYLGKTFWPAGLCVFYPYDHQVLRLPYALAGSLLVAISFLTYRLRRQSPYLPVGWLWFLGVTVPMIGLIEAGRQAYADRYMYLPIIGLGIMAAWGAPDLLRRIFPGPELRLKILSITGGTALAALMAATALQVGYWRNSMELFRRAVAVTRDNEIAYVDLGDALLEQHRYEEALACSEQVLRLAPGNARYRSNHGTILAHLGRFSEAEGYMRSAIELDPFDRELRDNLIDMRVMRSRLSLKREPAETPQAL